MFRKILSKKPVMESLYFWRLPRSSPLEVILRKVVLKLCSKFTGEHPCWSRISIKLQSNFIEIALWQGCPPVNLLHFFRAPFPKYTSGWMLLTSLKRNSSTVVFLVFFPDFLRIPNFFFYLGFSFTNIHDSQDSWRRGRGYLFNSSLSLHNPLAMHLDISWAITAEGSPLHIATSRTRTGNLWFPSASR